MTDETMTTETSAASEAAPAKRRPGRPRKTPAPEAPEATAQAAADPEPEAQPAKRRPGRPRKNPQSEAAGSEAPQEARVEASEEPVPAKRRPGRPRKSPAPETTEAETAPAPAAAAPAEASEEPVPAKRRGRPRKSPASEDPASQAEEHDAMLAAQQAVLEAALAAASAAQPDQAAPKEAQRQVEGESPVPEGAESRSPRRRRVQMNSGEKAPKADGQRQGGQQQGQGGQQQNQNNKNKNNRNKDRKNRNTEPVPSVTLEELAELKVTDLRERADELGLDHAGVLKGDLVQMVYDATLRKEGFLEVEGVLDVLSDGYGFLRTEGYLPGENDVYVGTALIRRLGLRKGDLVAGTTRPARPNDKFAAVQSVKAVNGQAPEFASLRPQFKDLTPVYPDDRLTMEHGKNTLTARVIDLTAPIGKGQRGLIVSPPKAGKTTVLKQIAAAIHANNPEVHLMCLLVDERPEEVTDMQRSVHGEVIASTFDMPSDNHIQCAEMVIERAKRLVEMGQDVVILLDSITRLARAYNLAQPASGRILSGGVDSTALYPPKRFLGAARNIEGGGSLTILASALVDTGSKMDEVIFEEFKGTGNMELKLDRNLADRRIYPAIDPVASGTRKEELLLDAQEAPLIWAVRRILANTNNTERAMDMLIKSLKQTETNQEFLLRTAQKAKGRSVSESIEL